MKCNYIYPYIVSEVSFASVEEHLKECKSCSERLERISKSMAILDEKIEVPSGLVEKTLRGKAMIQFPVKSSVDYSKYLQLAAVLAAGIFLGIFLGRNANSEMFLSKKEKKDKALLEYWESHHFNEPTSIFRF